MSLDTLAARLVASATRRQPEPDPLPRLRCGSPKCTQVAVAWGYYTHKAPTLVCKTHTKGAQHTLPITRMADQEEPLL